MDTNGTCCDDPNNKLHMAPPSSSAIAGMPAIATAAASNTRATTSSTGPLSSTAPSSTLHNPSTPEPTPTSTGRTMKLAVGLSVGLGVGALILLFWGVYAYYRRKRSQERFHKSQARCRLDALNTAARAARGYSRGWNSPFNRREDLAKGEQRAGSSAESAKSESVPTAVSRLASSERHAESRPPSASLTELPNSQNEQAQPGTDSAVDREPTAKPESGTLESEQHNNTSQQPNTSNRSENLTTAQSDGTSSPSPEIDRVAPRVPTPEEGSKSQEPAQDEGTSAAKSAESLQVEEEVQRQWSWQHGDDEHLQRSLAEQIELSQ